MKEQRELLEEAGWEPIESGGEAAWRRPGGLFLYPADVALRLARGEAGARPKEGGDRRRPTDEGAA